MSRLRLHAVLPLLLPAFLLALVGCGGGSESNTTGPVTWQMARDGAVTRTNTETGVSWTISIRTDRGKTEALQKAEDALSANPDIVGMVGLYAYNPPAILQAVEDRGILDQVTIVGFDEDPDTLAAIKEGKILGTVVQNPYEFGFRSVELLAATIREQEIEVPANGLMYVPTRVITEENMSAFSSEVAAIREGTGPIPAYDAYQYDTTKPVDIHFVTNVWDPFWKLAERGCEKAEEAFNAEVSVHMPPDGLVAQQKRYIDTAIINGADGIAISVRNPNEQVEMINEWCSKVSVIAVDSDADKSDRLFYLGTDNLAAGKQAGELLAKAVPDGGKVVIFVGELTQANARERAQGVIDALLGQD
jgi:ribose transport system substrate-binding protein